MACYMEEACHNLVEKDTLNKAGFVSNHGLYIFIFIYTIDKQQTINTTLSIVYHNHIFIIVSLLYTIYTTYIIFIPIYSIQ